MRPWMICYINTPTVSITPFEMSFRLLKGLNLHYLCRFPLIVTDRRICYGRVFRQPLNMGISVTTVKKCKHSDVACPEATDPICQSPVGGPHRRQVALLLPLETAPRKPTVSLWVTHRIANRCDHHPCHVMATFSTSLCRSYSEGVA
jgi:hypothetical protein